MSPPWYRQERGAGHKGQKGPYLYGVHGHKGISGDQFCLPKPANNATRRSWLDKFVLPLGDKTCCPKRNSLIKGELSKEALEAHRKLSRLQNFTLNAAAPLVAALEKLTKKKEPDPTAITSAIQLGLHFLGNVSAQFSVKRCCKALVRLNPDLKSMAEDEDFSQAPPFLFGPGFKKKAKERTDALEYLQKAAAKPNTQAFPHLTMAQHLGNSFFSWHPLPLQVPRQEWQQEQLPPTPLPQQRTPRSQTECCSQEGLKQQLMGPNYNLHKSKFFQKSFSKTYFNTNRGAGVSRERAASASHSFKTGHLAQYTHN